MGTIETIAALRQLIATWCERAANAEAPYTRDWVGKLDGPTLRDCAAELESTLASLDETPPQPDPAETLQGELLAALKSYKTVLSPWIQRPAKVSFAEWDAAVEQIERAIARAEQSDPRSWGFDEDGNI